MKSILVPTEDNSAMQSALETALLMARRFDSYIEGFALRWSAAQFAAFDPTGGIPLETDSLAAARMEKQAREIFESFMHGHNAPPSTTKTNALSASTACSDCYQRFNRMEPKHGAGTCHCTCYAASAKSGAGYGFNSYRRY